MAAPIRPVENWREVAKHAWSVRLMLLASMLSGLEVILPFVGTRIPGPEWFKALVLFGIVAGAFIARFVAQQRLGAK